MVDVFFSEDGHEDEKKSLFVKVPLTGDSSKNFKQVSIYAIKYPRINVVSQVLNTKGNFIFR